MKLLTWNIRWGRGADGRVDLARIVDHARRFADFDVLCLQEVASGFADLPGSDGGNQFEALAALLPGYTPVSALAVDAPGRGGARRRFGNMMLSRWPVQAVFRHLLPWPVDPGAARSMQRVALEATLDAPIGPLRVVTTHLEYHSATQRMAQVDRLRALHGEAVAHARSGPGAAATGGPFDRLVRAAPAVLLGDFNCRPRTPERARLLAPLDAGTPPWRDAWEHVHRNEPHAPTVGVHDKAQWPGEPFTFDYVFVSEDLAPRVRDLRVDASSDASDHQPVLLELA